MATKKDLVQHVNYLNEKYCKNTKNHFVISQAYGGYSVALTGKTYKRGNRTYWKKGSIGSGHGSTGANPYHDTATNTLNSLYKAEAKGWLQSNLKHYEKHGRY